MHTIASLLSLWFRELPESLLPVSVCEMMLELMDKKVSDEIFHDLLSNQLHKANLLCLGELLLLCQELCKNVDETKMTSENLAVCLTPDLIRGTDANNNPLSNLKMASTYGRLVKYMIEKANCMFWKPTGGETPTTTTTGKGAKKSGKKTLVKEKSKKLKIPTRPKDLPVMNERGNLGTVVATDAHHSNVEDELSFKANEKITIHQIHHCGWWFGANEKGEVGLFPAAKTNAGGVVLEKKETVAKIQNSRKLISPLASPRSEDTPSASSPTRGPPSKPPKPVEVTHNPNPAPNRLPPKPTKPKNLGDL
jgi:hypothetical protein